MHTKHWDGEADVALLGTDSLWLSLWWLAEHYGPAIRNEGDGLHDYQDEFQHTVTSNTVLFMTTFFFYSGAYPWKRG